MENYKQNSLKPEGGVCKYLPPCTVGSYRITNVAGLKYLQKKVFLVWHNVFLVLKEI